MRRWRDDGTTTTKANTTITAMTTTTTISITTSTTTGTTTSTTTAKSCRMNCRSTESAAPWGLGCDGARGGRDAAPHPRRQTQLHSQEPHDIERETHAVDASVRRQRVGQGEGKCAAHRPQWRVVSHTSTSLGGRDHDDTRAVGGAATHHNSRGGWGSCRHFSDTQTSQTRHAQRVVACLH